MKCFLLSVSFNLKREANPLATQSSHMVKMIHGSFNLKREANPLATVTTVVSWVTRFTVSISSEKPTLWRHALFFICRTFFLCFNLKREANPLATNKLLRQTTHSGSFNLKREANPLATNGNHSHRARYRSFNLKREANPLATCTQVATWKRIR